MSWPARRMAGAELFFERLTMAQHRVWGRGAADHAVRSRPGQPPRHPRRRCSCRSAGYSTCEPGRGLAAALRGFAPRIVIAWMSRAARFTPAGDWVLAGPVRRLLRPQILPKMRLPDCQHANALARWIVAQGWPARPHPLSAEFLHPTCPARKPERLGVPAGTPLGTGARPPASEQGVRRAHPRPGGLARRARDHCRGGAGARGAADASPANPALPDRVLFPGLAAGRRVASGGLRCARLPLPGRGARQRGRGGLRGGTPRRRRGRRWAEGTDPARRGWPAGSDRGCGGVGHVAGPGAGQRRPRAG